MRRPFSSAVWVAAAVVTAAGCSFSAGTSVSVDKDELAKEISAQLVKRGGRAPESVVCPDDLEGEVGATTRCTLNDAGTAYGVDVNVTKVEGTDVEFDLTFEDKPQ